MIVFKNQVKFALILLIFALFCISAVCAEDINSTGTLTVDYADEEIESNVDLDESGEGEVLGDKETPSIHVNSTEVTTGGEIEISLKDSNNASLANKDLTAIINDEDHKISTNDNGIALLKLSLPAKSYILQVIFKGDDVYSPINETFNIDVLKMDTILTPIGSSVIYGKYFYSYLTDAYGTSIDGAELSFKINGKTYTVNTNANGRAGLKITLASGKYSLVIGYDGNEYYNSISKTINLIVRASTSLVVGNSILLTNGYLRIYMKSNEQSAISKKTVKITINNKVYTKRTNSEGIIVFKPKRGTGTLKITVEFGGTTYVGESSAQKQVKGIKGNPRNPFISKISLRNGVPNVDYMFGSYVMADGDMKYSLTKAQYKAVIKRDSYCLYLNNKLSKYTVFKSKAEPKLSHIIKREKWNVIERAINTKIVKKNKNGYWPGTITVSLKGKSYTYPEVRDVQNTGYTCGPTASSMCTQVLRNYYCEKYLAQNGDATPSEGSSTKGLKRALEKFNFKCSIYYKSSFNKALKQLKKGGSALVFHTWGHFVSILDISKDGKKILVGNPSGDYDYGSHDIPTKWLTVSYMKKRFNNYDTSGLIVKLKYNLKKATKKNVNNFYYSMGTKWSRQNTNERLVQIQANFY